MAFQGGIQCAEASFFGLAFESAADLRVGRLGVEQPEFEGFEIESGAPGHYRQDPLPMQPVDARRCHGGIAGGVKGFIRLDHVDHMVGHRGLFRSGRFGRADIHPAIDLHRVGPHDFTPQMTGQADGGRGFTDAGGAADNHDAGMIGRGAHTN